MAQTIEKRIIQGEFDVSDGIKVYKAIFLGYVKFTGNVDRSEPDTIYEDGVIEGDVVDEYGIANIRGTIKGMDLNFTKKYVDRKDEIAVVYTKGGYNSEYSVYIGTWTSKGEKIAEGNTKCLITNEDQKGSFALDLTERAIKLAKKLMR
jgi:hypothetical protein